jgi:hypothetical protein
VPTELEQFFSEYALAAGGDAPEALAAFYADSFLAAGPRGSAAFKNDAAFLDWLRDVRAFNLHTGLQSMRVVSVRETSISSLYTLATVTWAATFEKTADRPVTFEISYIVDLAAARPRIVAYLAHQDEEEELRKLDLL